MSKQGCTSAINLDGGGSTSLYMHGKYMNESIGDQDEAPGQAVVGLSLMQLWFVENNINLSKIHDL